MTCHEIHDCDGHEYPPISLVLVFDSQERADNVAFYDRADHHEVDDHVSFPEHAGHPVLILVPDHEADHAFYEGSVHQEVETLLVCPSEY